MQKKYHRQAGLDEGNEVQDALEIYVREGARRMLASALEEEVSAYLCRGRYERGKEFRGYRNGYHASRELTVGLSPVEVRVPRVSDVPQGVSGFEPGIVRRYERTSKATQKLFARLYLEGLSTWDFEPVFRELVGESTVRRGGSANAVVANAVVRLKEKRSAEYEAFRKRELSGHRYAYIWADGIYLGAGMEKEKTALLCVLGAREDGLKELLSMEEGYRESTESWSAVLRDLRDRGLKSPLVAVGDGALGLWAALDEVYPETDHQRCLNHRVLNIQSSLPKHMHAEARWRVKEMYESETRIQCEMLRDRYVAELMAADQEAAAETVIRDWEKFVTFYRYPREHWIHLRMTNPLESIFSGVRIRTNAARRMKRRKSALYLVFKVVQRLSQNWKVLNGGANLMTLVLAGCVFRDGVFQHQDMSQMAVAAD